MAVLRKSAVAEFAFPGSANATAHLAADRKALAHRAANFEGPRRIAFARAAVSAVLQNYWNLVCVSQGIAMPLRLGPVESVEVSARSFHGYAEACVTLGFQEAFYEIGELYTCLLPDDHRTRHGVYYTPPHLVKRLLDLAEAQGTDWKTARVLDPACGGAAFAAYVAQRMLAANAHLSAEARLRDIQHRLVGIDIDSFATWLSAVLLDVVCLPLLREANTLFDGVIRQADSLAQNSRDLGQFDLVIGNPPYGKITLLPEQRSRFSRSLYGHANLYGLFTDAAVELTKPKGLIGFVTPTSFLGGEYFKNLRKLLLNDASPVHASFVSDREGVFSNVLQETTLTLFRRSPCTRLPKTPARAARMQVESVLTDSSARVLIEPLGKVTLPPGEGAPWVLPRSRSQLKLVRRLGQMPARLADYGYRVATGQLVWNRHKSQFRDEPGQDRYPVLWAECIQPDGTFEFRAETRNHRPFIRVADDQRFLVNQEPCVLVQRTTSKEQARRLIAASIPNSFVVDHPGYVVENHVNMLLPTRLRPAITLALLARLLNSATVDQAFRCISGSVAVSAYELENLPLPEVQLLACRVSFSRPMPSPVFEAAVHSLYHDA